LFRIQVLDRVGHQWYFAIMGIRFGKIAAALVLPLVFVPACQTAKTDPLLVAAAMSVKNAFQELGVLYETKTGQKVLFAFGASGEFQRQIERGAPVDVFASAAQKQMNALEAQGLIVTKSRQNFARNILVLIVPQDFGDLRFIKDLTNPRFKKIALGNPKTVPAGEYTENALTRDGSWEKLEKRFVFAENVHQVLQYVARGEADLGFVYATDVALARGKVIHAGTLMTDEPILYPLAITKDSRFPKDAQAFVDLVLGPEGQNILARWGFLSP
jgi:molybdate transport system substrate-binding protein